MTEDTGEMRDDFADILTEQGKTAIFRRRNITLDSAHGSPQSESTPTDTSIEIITHPITAKELAVSNSGTLKQGDIKGYVKHTVGLRNKDEIIVESEKVADGDTTITGTNATTVVISGDVRDRYAVNDYITIDDASNTGIYKITGVAFSSNTTLTVALDADPSTGDTVYRTTVFRVVQVNDWPDEHNTVYRKVKLTREQ